MDDYPVAMVMLQTVYQQADKATTYRVVTHSNRAQDQKVETR